MLRALTSAVAILILSASTAAAVLSNEQFCGRGVQALADSLVKRLAVPADSAVTLLPVDGRFGGQLFNEMAASLQRSGVPVYLVTTSIDSKRPVVKTTVNDYHLTYDGVQRGLFSQGRVTRMFEISGVSQLLESDGRMLLPAVVGVSTASDTLSHDEARAAWGKDGFLSPPLPPSVYQRLVEPGLIVGITGALVYLFFASR